MQQFLCSEVKNVTKASPSDVSIALVIYGWHTALKSNQCFIQAFAPGGGGRGVGVGSGEGRMSPFPVWGLGQSPRKIVYISIFRGAKMFARGALPPPPPGECLNEILNPTTRVCDNQRIPKEREQKNPSAHYSKSYTQ
jgi:hypothetical protein